MNMLPDKDIGYPGAIRLSPWTFTSGAVVPMFDVLTVHALNYIVGYAKRINKDDCPVYCRGQEHLYDNLRPSLYRGITNPRDLFVPDTKLNSLVEVIRTNNGLCAELGFPKGSPPPRENIEAMLQHYGIPTRMLDAVDNHWIALWFGLHRWTNEPVGGNPYAIYRKRGIHGIDVAEGPAISNEDLYQYILLIATPNSGSFPIKTHDLRLDLPQGLTTKALLILIRSEITQDVWLASCAYA